MKQKLLTLLLALTMTVFFAGCAGDLMDVGVIGGADGPTEIFITDGEDSWNETVDAEDSSDSAGWEEEDFVDEALSEDTQTESGDDQVYEDLASIDEAGTYSSMEDVSLYLYTYGYLPGNFITKNEARDLGWEGGSVERYAGDGYAIGGDKFGNREGTLPSAEGRQYYECDIDTVGASSRGAKRIVFSNDGLIYYTEDHYETFVLLYGEE